MCSGRQLLKIYIYTFPPTVSERAGLSPGWPAEKKNPRHFVNPSKAGFVSKFYSEQKTQGIVQWRRLFRVRNFASECWAKRAQSGVKALRHIPILRLRHAATKKSKASS